MTAAPGRFCLEALQVGVDLMKQRINSLAALAILFNNTAIGRSNEDEKTILNLCSTLTQPSSPLGGVLQYQSRCHEIAKGLYSYPAHEAKVRYCIETSLQAVEFASNILEFANRLTKALQKLQDRAYKRGQKKWNDSKEKEFWQDHDRLDHIAEMYTSTPEVPDQGHSIRPTTSTGATNEDIRIKDYLAQLDRLPGLYRTILSCLEKMSQEMAKKYYQNKG